jgi:hypothetical protein
MSERGSETAGESPGGTASRRGAAHILHSHYPWSEIGRRLGLTRQQVIARFRHLLATAGIHEQASVEGM